MQVTAQLNYHRMSPRKMRMIAKAIKGLDVDIAKLRMAVSAKKGSKQLIKLLSSAVANAENRFNLSEKDLFIKEIRVDEGPKLKRFKAKGFGLAMRIEKKVSHIRIVLDEISDEKKQAKAGLLSRHESSKLNMVSKIKTEEEKIEKQLDDTGTDTAESLENKIQSEKIDKTVDKRTVQGRDKNVQKTGLANRVRKIFRRKTG